MPIIIPVIKNSIESSVKSAFQSAFSAEMKDNPKAKETYDKLAVIIADAVASGLDQFKSQAMVAPGIPAVGGFGPTTSVGPGQLL